ncbi:MAG: malate synthase A [Gemmatimonadales bacterium]|nr:malate synthase A [Gemmatimonadales bacterium]
MTAVLPKPRSAPQPAVPPVLVRGPRLEEATGILTPGALALLAELHDRFEGARQAVLESRRARQAALDAGAELDFLPETAHVRDAEWVVARMPRALDDRRVEITGPVDRKMIINALNSGANVFMADFEDATSPTWANILGGQAHLRDAVQGTIAWTAPDGRRYALGETRALLAVRPRGLHLDERHLWAGGAPLAGGFTDAALFLFHNAQALHARGEGPLLYLPKLEHHLEARLWAEVLAFVEERLRLPLGVVKCTVLIETLPAAFQMDEILWELRARSAGLNCGRWDYIFSAIKSLRARPGVRLPDRGRITMDQGFLRAYAQLAVKTCHRRRAHAIGGMAAQLPVKGDEAANAAALARVVADKTREAGDGHDGTWVAHPSLVAPVRAIFDAALDGRSHQQHRLREDVRIGATELLRLPEGAPTERGVRLNIEVAIRYLAAWLDGQGAVPIHHLMEDAATAEISRTQLWQWLRQAAVLDDGRPLTRALYRHCFDEELRRVHVALNDRPSGRQVARAAALLDRLVTADDLADFLTLPAYEMLLAAGG